MTFSNLAEYLAHTNPTNGASALRFTSTTKLENGEVRWTWSSVGGTRYRIEYADDLARGSTEVVRGAALETDPSPPGNPSSQTYSDKVPVTTGVRFYRVKVVP